VRQQTRYPVALRIDERDAGFIARRLDAEDLQRTLL